MDDPKPQPMRRKLLGILCGLPWLSACASTIKDWAAVPSATAPFYRGQPTAVEERTVSTMSGSRGEVRYRAGYRTFNREDAEESAWRLVQMALGLGLLKWHVVKAYDGRMVIALEVVSDKRAFLVSMKPDILFLIPWQFKMDDEKTTYTGSDGKPLFDDRSLRMQLTELHKEQEQRFGLLYSVVPLRGASAPLYGELSPIFPDVEGIQAVSDKWEGVRTLAEMEADRSIPFKIEPDSSRPGFRRLVLR